MAGEEGKVGLAPEGSGPPVRVLKVTTNLRDPITGITAPAVVDMQVIAIADESGDVLDLDAALFQREVIAELRAIRSGIELAIGRELRKE